MRHLVGYNIQLCFSMTGKYILSVLKTQISGKCSMHRFHFQLRHDWKCSDFNKIQIFPWNSFSVFPRLSVFLASVLTHLGSRIQRVALWAGSRMAFQWIRWLKFLHCRNFGSEFPHVFQKIIKFPETHWNTKFGRQNLFLTILLLHKMLPELHTMEIAIQRYIHQAAKMELAVHVISTHQILQ